MITREKFLDAIECLDHLHGNDAEEFDAILALNDAGIFLNELAPSGPGQTALWISDTRDGSTYPVDVESWRLTEQVSDEMEFECEIRSRDMNCVEWEELQETPSWKRVEMEVLREQVAIKVANDLGIEWE